MRRKNGLNILYGFITIIALVTACGGIGTAAEGGVWIEDNIYKITRSSGAVDGVRDGVIYQIYDDATSTLHVFETWSTKGLNMASLEESAQIMIDETFGEVHDGYKTNWLQLAIAYKNEILLFSKKAGEKEIYVPVHCLLIGACDEVSTNKWEESNVFVVSQDDTISLTGIYDDNSRTLHYLIVLSDVTSVASFKARAQSIIDDNLGESSVDRYKINWIQVAAEFDDEILLLSQKVKEEPIFLSIPSQVGFSATVRVQKPQPTPTPIVGGTIFETCKMSSDTRLCGHLGDLKGKYPALVTCLDYCMYETLRIPQTWSEYEKCLRLGCKALHDSVDKIQLNNKIFMEDIEYIWKNIRSIS